MQGLSLIEQQHRKDVMPIDLDDNLIFTSELNDYENEANDDHGMVLNNEKESLENLMDQGLDVLIQGEAPT
jgi:hypothetical protein